MNDPSLSKPKPGASAWDILTVEQFCSDAAAVTEWRQFLATETGGKLAAVVRGSSPVLAITLGDAASPAIIRSASKMESEAAESLLGKAVGHTLLETLLFRRLTVPRTDPEPRSARVRGRREVVPAAAVMP